MAPAEALTNLGVFALQLGVLVSAARALEAALPVDRPQLRLTYWQGVMILAIVLPFVQPWRAPRPEGPPSMTAPPAVLPAELASARPPSTAAPTRSPVVLTVPAFVFGVLGLGSVAAAARLGLAAGALRRARRRSRPVTAGTTCAELRLSSDVKSPVTYGWRRPVVLLPEAFLRLGEEERRGVVCHELVHVERHHWLAQIVEEALRVTLWFHPAFHWLLGRLRLAREQAVDAEVVRRLGSRTSYLEALVDLATSGRAARLAPAPAFFTRSHLVERVDLLLKEEPMSRVRVVLSLVSSAVAVALCAAGAVALVPYQASAESAVATLPPITPVVADANAAEAQPPSPPSPPAPAAPPAPPVPARQRQKNAHSADERAAIEEERRHVEIERKAVEHARQQLEQQIERLTEQAARIGEEAARKVDEKMQHVHEATAHVHEKAARMAEEQARHMAEQARAIEEQAHRKAEEHGRRAQSAERERALQAKIAEMEARTRELERQLEKALADAVESRSKKAD